FELDADSARPVYERLLNVNDAFWLEDDISLLAKRALSNDSVKRGQLRPAALENHTHEIELVFVHRRGASCGPPRRPHDSALILEDLRDIFPWERGWVRLYPYERYQRHRRESHCCSLHSAGLTPGVHPRPLMIGSGRRVQRVLARRRSKQIG